MRYYSSTATPKSLNTAINSSVTTLTVNNTTGLPIPSFPFTVVIDPDTATEEVLSVTASSGNVLTIARAQDGTAASSHSAGAIIKHMVTARDLQEPQNHMNTGVGVHGLSGTVVGTTDTQTLTNKSMSGLNNTFTSIPQSSVTNLSGDLAAKANTTHSHAESDVTNLVSDLAAKAPLLNPLFLGVPSGPTAAQDTSTTQFATTSFVMNQISNTAPAAVGATASIGSSTRFARADHVHTGSTAVIAAQLTASTITVTAGGYFNFSYDGETVDNTNGHSTTVNPDRFTITTPGYYHITARTQVNNATVAEQTILAITKNGAGQTGDSNVMSYMTGAGKSQTVSTNAILFLTSGDYVGARYYCYNSGTTLTFSTFTIQFLGI